MTPHDTKSLADPALALPAPPARAMALIAARVDEVAGALAGHLAIASEQAPPKPTLRARLAAKLRSLRPAAEATSSTYDATGYYPVRRSA